MSKQNPQRATRADVAKEAGTSVAVVSYVVNNGPRPVAPATRERVLAAIKKIGYRPNNVARALASGTTKTYGLVVPNINNAFIASLANALQQEAQANDMVMLLGDSGDNRKRELQLINNLLGQQVNGLIYTSVDRHPYIDVLQASNTPFVMLDRVDPSLQVSVLRVDERAASRQVTAHLLSHGYQDVGIISGPLEMLNAQDRLQGWREALAEQGVAQREEWGFRRALHPQRRLSGGTADAAGRHSSTRAVHRQRSAGDWLHPCALRAGDPRPARYCAGLFQRHRAIRLSCSFADHGTSAGAGDGKNRD